jgi:adenine nucleotide transporter 17
MEILKKEGLAGLYAGLDSSIAGIVVTNTVFYLFRESFLLGFDRVPVTWS